MYDDISSAPQYIAVWGFGRRGGRWPRAAFELVELSIVPAGQRRARRTWSPAFGLFAWSGGKSAAPRGAVFASPGPGAAGKPEVGLGRGGGRCGSPGRGLRGRARPGHG